MTDRNTGRFVWHELVTTDLQAAIAFYQEVVGWTTKPWDERYSMWVGGQGPLGGVSLLAEEARNMGASPHWMGSVRVADCDATAARAREHGGSVPIEPRDIPTIGRFAVIGDPTGASVAIIQPLGGMDPHDAEKHGEVAWNELITTDQEAALAFYQAVFGWERLLAWDLGPAGVYPIYGREGHRLGGILKKPEGAPAPMRTTFVYYIQVDDLDAAFARAQKLGATVLIPPMGIPGGARIAQLLDPQGAWFALYQRAAAAPAA